VTAGQATLGGVQDIAGDATLAFDLVAAGDGEAAQGTLDLTLSHAGYAAADVAVNGASLEQRLDWRYAAGTLTLQATQPGVLAIESIAAHQRGLGRSPVDSFR
jgi:autotransporter translocation and assembly factor TamB